jgi:hypothetical protein
MMGGRRKNNEVQMYELWIKRKRSKIIFGDDKAMGECPRCKEMK